MMEFRCPHCGKDIEIDAVINHTRCTFDEESPLNITDSGRCPECHGDVVLRGMVRQQAEFWIETPDESIRKVAHERVFPLRYDTLRGDRLDLRIESRDPDVVDVMRKLFACHELNLMEVDTDECYVVIGKPEGL